jgi:hypothetical protein
MLIERTPEELLEWAKSYVKFPYDRPWYYEEPPLLIIEYYRPPCRCKKAVRLNKYPCVDSGFVYLGQCEQCETIVWSRKEL